MDFLKSLINSPHEERPKGFEGRQKAKFSYEITQELIDNMMEYTRVFNKLKKKDPKEIHNAKIIRRPNDNIAVIYVASNKRTGNKYVGYTTNKLYTFIKLNLHKRNLGEETIFSYFSDTNLKNITFQALEFIKYDFRKDIFKRKEFYKRKYEGQFGGNDDDDPDSLYDKRISVFIDVFKKYKNKFIPYSGFIFVLENKDNNKAFVGGVNEKIDKDEIIEILKRKEKISHAIKKYGEESFDLKYIEKYNAACSLDFNMRVDYVKMSYDAVSNGYNDGYLVEDSPVLFDRNLPTRTRERLMRKFFLILQKAIMEKEMKDPYEYNKMYGYVYEIKNKRNGKRFFSHSHGKTLKDIVRDMYKEAIKGNIKQNKMLKALSLEPFENFRFKIIRSKNKSDFRVSLAGEVQDLIIKYNSVENGYNLEAENSRKMAFDTSNKKNSSDLLLKNKF